MKKQFKTPSEYKRFKKLVEETKIYDEPATLNGHLRPYQKIGYSWLLADDMGLGKTIQILTTILYFKEKNKFDNRPTLIIVPPTLISNWENEINKFTPELTYYIYHGPGRTYPIEEYDIILTSYGVVRLDLDLFMDDEWIMCVIDEAQNIKNPNTEQTRAIKSIKASTKVNI